MNNILINNENSNKNIIDFDFNVESSIIFKLAKATTATKYNDNVNDKIVKLESEEC